MKKYVLTLGMASAIVLAACGDDSANEEPQGTATAVEEGEQTEEVATEETASDTEESNEEATEEPEEDPNKPGVEVEENEHMKATNTITNKDLGISGTIGPMEYSIDGIQFKEVEIKSEDAASMFEAEVGDVIQAFTIDFTGENTSDEDMNFYLGQAVAITSTKEQLEPDMMLSEYIPGEYLGQVQHTGYNVYVLENSNLTDIESIEVRIQAPMDSNYDTVGEDVSHTIEINQ